MKCHSSHQNAFPNRSGSNLYHAFSHCHVPEADHNFRERGKPFFFSSGNDLYRDHVNYFSHESGYHSSGGHENGFHSLGRESRYDRSCPGMCRSDSRSAFNFNRVHRERDHSISRVESKVGVLHADRRAGYFQKDFAPSFLYEREWVGSGGLVHSSTHDHSLSRPESRTGGMHHSSSVHEHCSSRPESRAETRQRPESRNHDHSRPESRCAHERPESRGPTLCPEHSRAGLIHSSSSGFDTGFPDRVQTGLHHSSSGQLSSSAGEGYSEPGFHSEGERFADRPIFRSHDFHAHPSQKLVDSPFRFSCPVHSPFRFRYVNGGPDYFGHQVSK